MMIPGIRTYIQSRIQEVDPNLQPWTEDVFGNNDVSSREADFNYNLFYGSLFNDRLSNVVDDTLPIFIDIWARTNRSTTVEDFDNLYQKAFDIYKNITCLANLKGLEDSFTTIQLVSITPLEEETSDNTFKMRIELNVVKTFCY